MVSDFFVIIKYANAFVYLYFYSDKNKCFHRDTFTSIPCITYRYILHFGNSSVNVSCNSTGKIKFQDKNKKLLKSKSNLLKSSKIPQYKESRKSHVFSAIE